MPVSAYLNAALFVVAAAAALFAAAGTIAIPGFWAYLAIFASVMIVSFAALDPDLLRERMRPGGKKPPLALRVFSLVPRARIVARGRIRYDLQPAVSALSRYHGGSNSSGRACGLFGLRRASPMAARPWHLVRQTSIGKARQTRPSPSRKQAIHV
jgi:hypothetical protein